VLSGFTWFRKGIVGGLLWMRWWTFGFWRHGVSYLIFVKPVTEKVCITYQWNGYCSVITFFTSSSATDGDCPGLKGSCAFVEQGTSNKTSSSLGLERGTKDLYIQLDDLCLGRPIPYACASRPEVVYGVWR
jgi:hypothetical protein